MRFKKTRSGIGLPKEAVYHKKYIIKMRAKLDGISKQLIVAS
jgi:hypothetical protein